MAAVETVTSLEGLFKQQYPEGLPDLIPNMAKLQKDIKFAAKELELGDSYVQPVRMSYPTGFTHAASAAGAFTLNSSVAGQLKKATVDGSQILLRDQVDMESAAKASKGSKKAFEDIVSVTFEGLQKSMRKRIETELFYGSASIGQLSAVAGSSTTRTWTITTAEFAPGIWSGNEGMSMDVWSALTAGTQRNLNADVVLTSVDLVARTLAVSGNATDLTACVAGDYLFFKGAYTAEMAGVHKILTNTGSLFGINASTYNLWSSASHAITGALSFNAVKKAVAKAVGKGCDEDVNLYVNPKAWDDLLTDISSTRKTDKSETSKVVIGANEIEFHSINGSIKVIPSIYVKEGYAYGLAMPYWQRIGAADVTFNMPGFGDQLFFVLPSSAGVEARCYTHQAIFCDAPGKNFVVTGIVNSL